jgi:septal ring factor EnvC (AmiA/AmiB activator)
MTTRPYELLARFAMNGTIGGASIRRITALNGRDYEGDPEPLAGAVNDPAFAAFAEQFSAQAVAELESTKVQLADVQKQLSDANQQITALHASIDELAATREQLATVQAALGEANAKIVELQNALPWDVRIIDAAAFVARVTPTELLDLAGSADEVRQQIAQMLLAYKQNDWPILLDSPEMQQAIGYLVQSGAISEERSAELLRDSSQAEAYKAGE